MLSIKYPNRNKNMYNNTFIQNKYPNTLIIYTFKEIFVFLWYYYTHTSVVCLMHQIKIAEKIV